MPNPTPKKLFYTVDELHNLMTDTVSKATIYYLIKQGKIPSKRLGEKPLIPAAWVDDFLYTPVAEEYIEKPKLFKNRR